MCDLRSKVPFLGTSGAPKHCEHFKRDISGFLMRMRRRWRHSSYVTSSDQEVERLSSKDQVLHGSGWRARQSWKVTLNLQELRISGA